MDKRYFASLGILLALVLVAWAIGPANFQKVATTPTEDQQPSPAAQESSSIPNAATSGPVAEIAALPNQSRVPKSLFNGTWGGDQSRSIDRAPKSGISSPNKSTQLNPITLNDSQSRSQQNSTPKVKLGTPSASGGSKSSLAGFTRSKPSEKIPGRESDSMDQASVSQNRTPQIHALRPIHQSTKRRKKSTATLDYDAIASKLVPIKKVKSQPVSRQPRNQIANSPLQFQGTRKLSGIPKTQNRSRNNHSTDSDPLFRPIISPDSIRNNASKNSIGGVRGLPFSLAGHQQPPGKSQIGIPGVKKPKLPASTQPKQVHAQEYIWHVLSSNETLQSIASAYEGDASMVRKLIQMNQDIIKDPNLLPVGKAIRIPVR